MENFREKSVDCCLEMWTRVGTERKKSGWLRRKSQVAKAEESRSGFLLLYDMSKVSTLCDKILRLMT